LRWALLFLFVAFPAFAQKIEADVQCKHSAGKKLLYNCIIRLTRGGEPLSGAQLTVGADMPSMPMAHNTRPVKARPGKNPGEYHARLELEMHGEWAVKLRIAGPVRDQIIKKLDFD
jgi:YtkA-like protein